MTQDKKFVDLDNAREDDQRQVMAKIQDSAHCPFCPDQLKLYHQQPILKESQHWLVTHNQWPYDHTRHHFLLILKVHGEKLADLPAGAGDELLELAGWLETEYQIPGGGLVMRFGETEYSAGSVTHLHAQLVVPDVGAIDFKPTRIKLGKS